MKESANVRQLTHFMPLVSFYASWKRQKTSGFLMFLGGIEGDQWHEMSLYLLLKIISIKKLWKTEMYILWYLIFCCCGCNDLLIKNKPKYEVLEFFAAYLYLILG